MKRKKGLNANLLGHIILILCLVLFFFTAHNLPLLSTPGFDSANFLVAILGPIICLLAAIRKEKNPLNNFKPIFIKESIWLFLSLGLILGFFVINGLNSKSCSQSAGIVPFLVIIFPTLFLNLLIGTFINEIFKKVWLKILIVISFYLIYYGLILTSWWQEPQFRIFTHLSFTLASDLVNGGILHPAIYSFKLATLLYTLGLFFVGMYFFNHNSSNLFHNKNLNIVQKLAPIAFLFIVAFLIGRSSEKKIVIPHQKLEQDYDLRLEKHNIIVRANPRNTSKKEAADILDEAIYYKLKLQKKLDAELNKSITIWLHKNNQEKFYYTGAKNVHFALPKHRQTHIAFTKIPHPVLGHELAHIFVGEFTNTLFGFVGTYKVLPNFALTEGLAMYLTHELNVENGLSALEQAKALYQTKIKPDINQLFSQNPLYFLKTDMRFSYISSEAYLTYIFNQYPKKQRAKKIIDTIVSGNVSALFKNKKEYLQSLREFESYLRKEPKPYALTWAHRKQSPLSVLARNCDKRYKKQEESFQIALINNDIEKIIDTITALPTNDTVTFLNRAINDQLKKKRYDSALRLLLKQKKLSPKTHNINSSLNIKMITCYYNLGKIKKTREIINELNINQYLISNQRRIEIVRIFIDEIYRKDHDPLYDAGIKLLLNSKDKYHLIQSTFIHEFLKRQYSSVKMNDALLMAHYVYARILYHANKKNEALKRVFWLLKRQSELSQNIASELNSMNATIHFSQARYKEALTIYQKTIKMPLSEGEEIIIRDKINRIKFILADKT